MQRRVPDLHSQRQAGDLPSDISFRSLPADCKQTPQEEGKISSFLSGSDIELNWTTLARLAELAYRCTLCRRCAQACPIGVDNALIAREIRKLFSQELGIAPSELHEQGTVQAVKSGFQHRHYPKALANIVAFMEDEIEEKTGKRITIPVDKEGADVLAHA